MNATDQILKSRDDKFPLVLSPVVGDPCSFSRSSAGEPTWLKAGEQVTIAQLRGRLEPWLTALFQSEHLSLLVGSGLSHAVHHIATGQTLPGMSQTPFFNYGAAIDADAARSAQAMGRQAGNLEDQLRTANDLYAVWISWEFVLSRAEPSLLFSGSRSRQNCILLLNRFFKEKRALLTHYQRAVRRPSTILSAS